MKHVCYVCCRKADNKCGGCGFIYYCSPACQRKDWKEHKLVCKTLDQKGIEEARAYCEFANGRVLEEIERASQRAGPLDDESSEELKNLTIEEYWRGLYGKEMRDERSSAAYRLVCAHYLARIRCTNATTTGVTAALRTISGLADQHGWGIGECWHRLLQAEKLHQSLFLPEPCKIQIAPLALISDRQGLITMYNALHNKDDAVGQYLKYMLDNFPAEICADMAVVIKEAFDH